LSRHEIASSLRSSQRHLEIVCRKFAKALLMKINISMRLFKYIRLGFNAVMISVYTLVGTSILFALFPVFRRRMYVDFLTRLWVRFILITCGVKISVEGSENLERGELYVFVANHQSLFDIPACIAAIPARLRMLAKKELFRIPVFGWGMWGVGHVRIDREDRKKAVKSVGRAVERLKSENISPLVFPEGTRSPDGKIHPFKKGAFVLAVKAQRKVVPVTITGSRNILPKKSFFISPGAIHVIIDKPIDTQGMNYENRETLAKNTHDIIEKRFYSAPDFSKNEPGTTATNSTDIDKNLKN